MLNNVVLVGRLVRNPELMEYSKGKYSKITLAVPRSYKSVTGEYETDFVDCTLWQGVAESTTKFCKKGDIVGVKGRLQSSSYEKDEKKVYVLEVIAEKVTFLSNKPVEENHDEESIDFTDEELEAMETYDEEMSEE